MLSKVTHIVIDERIHNPCATLRTIGQKAGVTQERVRQILKKHSLATRGFVNHEFICIQCRGKFPSKYLVRFCSPKCKHNHFYIPLSCSNCGNIFHRRRSEVIMYPSRVNHPLRHGNGRKFVFCNKKCQGEFLGKQFGFVAHPENQRYKRLEMK